ncbi:MAG: hypothetical protein H0U57_03060 [Tatlockia sp.]|nr:hypothetical protein [Tatlockia sp.]
MFLFKAAFRKLQKQLSTKELLSIFCILKHAYEGSRLSDTLGLASTLLSRGNICFIHQAEWMLGTLQKEGRGEAFLNDFLTPKT